MSDERDPKQLGHLAGTLPQVLGFRTDLGSLVMRLYDAGVRVIDPQVERVVRFEDGPTYAETVSAWQKAVKQRYPQAKVGADESEPTFDVKATLDIIKSIVDNPEETLLATLRDAGEPLTFTEMLHRGIGRPYGGRAAPEWRLAFMQLQQTGRIVRGQSYDTWQIAP